MRYDTVVLQCNPTKFDQLAIDLKEQLVASNPNWNVVAITPLTRAGDTVGLMVTLSDPAGDENEGKY
jgi:hypothetical protein